jgi:hypothetical protein
MFPLLILLGVAVAALALGGGSNGAPGAPGKNANPWDQNLSPSEVIAVTQALSVETDPNKLDAFSQSMLPDHPLAAAALASPAMQLRLAMAGNLPAPALPPMPAAPAAYVTPASPPVSPLDVPPPFVPGVLPPPPADIPPPPPAMPNLAAYVSTSGSRRARTRRWSGRSHISRP